MNMKIAILSALFAVTIAAPAEFTQSSTPVPIVSQGQEYNPEDGSYSFNFQAGNGIAAEARATFQNSGSEGPAPSVQGFYSYPGPDGNQYQLVYVADQNGFQASGSHLPTPPALPEELAKAFAEAPQDGHLYDQRGFPIQSIKQINKQ